MSRMRRRTATFGQPGLPYRQKNYIAGDAAAHSEIAAWPTRRGGRLQVTRTVWEPPMKSPASLVLIINAVSLVVATTSQAAPARYYKWQGADRVVCAQTSPGEGWKRLKGFFVKSDCSI